MRRSKLIPIPSTISTASVSATCFSARSRLEPVNSRSRELSFADSDLERLKQIRPGDVVFRMHLIQCLGQLADVENDRGDAVAAETFARRALSEAEETLSINPKYHPAADGVARMLLSEAEIAWDHSNHDRTLLNLDRAEAILRGLVASQPEVINYQFNLAGVIRAHVQMDSELGREQDAERRLREAVDVIETALRGDPARS